MKFEDLFNNFFRLEVKLSMSREEKRLASIIQPIVYEELKGQQRKTSDDELETFDEKIEAVKENLKLILELFERANKSRFKYKKCFPKWFKTRGTNIDNLTDIADSIDQDRLNCNISKLVGCSVGILGSIALATCLAFPPAAAVILPLSIGGFSAIGLGGATVFGTSAVEITLLKKKMNEATKILQEDQETFKAMNEWVQHTIHLSVAIETVIGFEVIGALVRDLKEFRNDFQTWNSFEFKFKLRNCMRLLCCAQKIVSLDCGMDIASMIITFLVVTVLLRIRNCFVFDCMVLTHRLVFGLLTGLDFSVEVGRAILMAIRGGKVAAEVSANVARAVFHGVFAGIGIALDLVNLVLTAIDVHKGSISKHAKEIRDVVVKLKEEQLLLKEVYQKL